MTVDTGGIDARLRARWPSAPAPWALRTLDHARADYFEQVLRFLVMGNARAVIATRAGVERVMQAQTIARMARQLGSTWSRMAARRGQRPGALPGPRTLAPG